MQEDPPQDNKYEELLPLGDILVLHGNKRLKVRGCKALQEVMTDFDLVTLTHSGGQHKVDLVKYPDTTTVQEHAYLNTRTALVGEVVERAKLKQPFEKRKRNYEVVDVMSVPVDPKKKVPMYMKSVLVKLVQQGKRKKHQFNGKLVSTVEKTMRDRITPNHTAVGFNIHGNGNVIGKYAMSQRDAEIVNREMFIARAERANKRNRST